MFNPKITLSFILIILVSFTSSQVMAQQSEESGITPKPRIVVLNLDSENYQPIFDGSPETIQVHSGLVTLKPDESVGIHNTEVYEEMIVVLEGEGKMMVTNGADLQIRYGVIAYCPPNTEHNIKNTGLKPLKYIYIASKAK